MKALNTQIFSLLLYFIMFSCFSGCEKQTTPITTTNISLTAEYVGITEVELLLSTDLKELPDNYHLLRNGEVVLTGKLIDNNTFLWDTTLQPAHTYTYRVNLLRNNVTHSRSNELNLTTMDTTIHDFQWEIFELPSPYGSGALYDVAIINENDIWAVGEIYADSANPWLPYNAVHWDGQQWELKRINFFTICGQSSLTPYPAKSVLAFSTNDIWIAMDGDQITHWNGHTQDMLTCLPVSFTINEIWGTDSDNLYAVGAAGTIFHLDGQGWKKLESGTDLPIQDIWGAKNPISGEELILCVASRLDQKEGRELLKIHHQNVEKLQVEGLSWSLKAIWFIPDMIYYIGGDGLYPSRNLDVPWKRDVSFPQLYKHAIRGQAVNDVVVAGSFGLLSHFNGLNWKHYSGGTLPSASTAYRGVAIHVNIIVATGYHDLRNGLVVIGRRK